MPAQNAKVKSKVKSLVRTMTRTAVLQNTAARFLEVAKELGAGTDWYLARLDRWIAHELISSLDIVVNDDGQPVAGVNLTFDWHEHETLCTIQKEVGVDFEEGDTYVSTKEIVSVIGKYLGGAKKLAKRPHVTIWYCTNPEARRKLGTEEFERLLDHYTDADHEEWAQRQWSKVRMLQSTRQKRRTIMPDVSEVSTTAY